MEWSEFFCLCFLLTNITGTVACVCYMIFQKQLEKLGLKLIGLKIVIWMYLIPIIYTILRLSQISYTSAGWVDTGYSMKDVAPKYRVIYKYIDLAWGIGLAVEVVMRARQYLKFRKIMKANIPVKGTAWNWIVDECSEKYRLKSVKIYQNPYVDSALVTGIFKPIIVAPDTEYFPDETYMIAEHELYHIHNKDLMWKQLAMLVSWLHWYNPLVYWVISQVVMEQEINCDLAVCSVNRNYTNKQYCQFLFELAVKGNDRIYAASLVETKSLLARRIERMAGKKQMKKVSQQLALLICLIFVMASAFPAYAIGDTIIEIEEEWIKSKEVSFDLTNEPVKEVIVYKEIDDGTVDEVYVDDTVSAYSLVVSVDDTIAAYTRYLYSSRELAEGDEVTIVINCSDSSLSFRIGIKNEDTGEMYYIQGTGTLSHTFSVSVEGTYRAFIENRSNESADFKGSIVYP